MEPHAIVLDGLTNAHGLGSGDSYYVAAFLNEEERTKTLERCEDEISYVPRDQLMYRGNKLCRDQQFYGDIAEDGSHGHYGYPGFRDDTRVHIWTPTLRFLRDDVALTIRQRLNHCVVNKYLGGSDRIGFHADRSDDFEPGTSVATVSLGSARTFCLKKNDGSQLVTLAIQPGSLFVMGWRTNQEWQHSIRRTQRPVGMRISITLRHIATRWDPTRRIKTFRDGTVVHKKEKKRKRDEPDQTL